MSAHLRRFAAARCRGRSSLAANKARAASSPLTDDGYRRCRYSTATAVVVADRYAYAVER